MTSQVGFIRAFHPGRICSLNCFTRRVLGNRRISNSDWKISNSDWRWRISNSDWNDSMGLGNVS